MLPAGIVLVLALLLGVVDGGFPPPIWYPAALFLLVLLALTLGLLPPARKDLPRLVLAMLAVYAAFTAWNFLSILWADAKGDAWDGANKTLLYGLAFAIVTLRPWSRRSATAALALVGFGTAAIAACVLALSALRSDPSGLFLEARLSEPTGYANATANLWLIGFWPAVHLAGHKLLSWPLRGLSLAAACLLLETAVLSQSRGALLAFALTAVLYLALVPRRLPALLALAVPVLLALGLWGTLIEVRESQSLAQLETALADARGTIAVSCLIGLLAGGGAAFLGRRWPPQLTGTRALRVGDLGVAALAAAALAAALVAIGDPGDWLDGRWRDFKSTTYEQVEAGTTRFGSLGSNRYDFYRVALNEFRAHPVGGIGADNYAAQYLLDRRSPEAPRYPHSLAFRLLAQVGAVGTFLFLAFLALGAVCVGRTLLRGPPPEAGLAVAALSGVAIWILHGLADWLWEFPALGVMSLALLGVSVRVTANAPSGSPRSPSPRLWPRVLAGALGALALISLLLPGLAAFQAQRGYDRTSRDPRGAVIALDSAAKLNFLSTQPLIAKAVLSRRLGERSEARVALQEALQRDPNNWFAHFELGLLEAGQGNRAAANGSFALALLLNPRQPLIRSVAARAATGQRIDATAVEQELYQQLGAKLRPVHGPPQ
jgi:tetratricopeptide (TPR) repeat protein